jgi:hypothetical protein
VGAHLVLPLVAEPLSVVADMVAMEVAMEVDMVAAVEATVVAVFPVSAAAEYLNAEFRNAECLNAHRRTFLHVPLFIQLVHPRTHVLPLTRIPAVPLRTLIRAVVLHLLVVLP